MRREVKRKTEALAGGAAGGQSLGSGVTTGFNIIQVLCWIF